MWSQAIKATHPHSYIHLTVSHFCSPSWNISGKNLISVSWNPIWSNCLVDPRLEYQGRASAINEKSVNLETLICRWRNICWHTFAPVIGQRLQLPLSNMKLNNKSVVNGYCLRRKQQFWAEKWDGWEAGMRRSLVHPTESNSPILPVLGLGSQVRAAGQGGGGGTERPI